MQWIEALKSDINVASISDAGTFTQFYEECAFAIDSAQRVGRGSLIWNLAEDRVPADKVAEYIMRPEHGVLLDDYSAT